MPARSRPSGDHHRPPSGVWCYPQRLPAPSVLGHRTAIDGSEQIADSVAIEQTKRDLPGAARLLSP